MSTESTKRSVVVGIFVLLGIIIFVAGVFVLGGQQKRFTRSIRLMTVFKDVGGLKVGNNVWFSGVKIGTVKRISFFGTAQVEVDLNIEQSSQQYIRKDATASIGTDGLIGNKIVVIAGGTNSHPEVEEGDRLKTSEALSSDQIMATLQENNNNLLRVTNDFKELVGNLRRGKGTVGAVLTDSLVAENFKRAMRNLERASDNTVKITGSVSQFAAKLGTKGSLAHELVTDTTVFRRLSRSAARFETVAGSADQAVTNINRSSENLHRASEKLNNTNSPLGVLLTDQETATNLRTTLRNLSQGTVLLNEDLKAAQSNFLLRGFFKKQSKAEAKRKADSTAAAQP
ncbi:MlaD family protein [Spirosoma validum]|uniref:MCE family protein n=1 Tax=Spirosoma validum TaxID=2771355 RepID=A0A927B1U8_9BACT|nr:MlaD family protein [Spirosoma validum]MBD2753868.1 MCE family protein [Spirosoma validum]